MDILDAMKHRRTIRAYKTALVEQNVLDTILEAGRLAPSWGNTQTWRWVIIKDQNIKNEIADTVLRPGNRGIGPIKTAPVVIAACAELNKAGFRDGQPSTDKSGYWYMFDAALALEHMVLVAESFRLGTLFVGGMDSKKLEAILDVPPGYTCVILMVVGHPDEKPEARPRKTIEELVYKNKFGIK
jgi:nitroreductase